MDLHRNALEYQIIYKFNFPLGATINMDGTALFECVVVVFLAQLFGVEMGFVTQFTVVLMALNSIGVAGIPSASLVAIIVIHKQLVSTGKHSNWCCIVYVVIEFLIGLVQLLMFLEKLCRCNHR